VQHQKKTLNWYILLTLGVPIVCVVIVIATMLVFLRFDVMLPSAIVLVGLLQFGILYGCIWYQFAMQGNELMKKKKEEDGGGLRMYRDEKPDYTKDPYLNALAIYSGYVTTRHI
jgi:hypothetical protein